MAEVGVRDGNDHRSDSGERVGPGPGRVEVSATAGWTFSTGVEADEAEWCPAWEHPTASTSGAFSWGLRLEFFAGENSEIGFLSISNQRRSISKERRRQGRRHKVNNYHGYYAYNFGEGDAEFARTCSSGSGRRI